MNSQAPWYENDDFWQTLAPVFFSSGRIQQATEEVTQMIARLGIQPPGPVLDLCCGVGRHSLELARRGFSVTGVDRTTTYLEQAHRQAEVEDLKVEFVQEDMRNFVRPGYFTAAISMFTWFGYFADPLDDAAVCRNAWESLKPNGAFLIDVASKEVLARNYRERDWSEQDGIIMLEERLVNPDWSGLANRWIMFKGTERHEFRFALRLYSGVELTQLLRNVGFRDVEVFGDLSAAPYDHTAKRLIAMARK